jgi:hypothetical protein
MLFCLLNSSSTATIAAARSLERCGGSRAADGGSGEARVDGAARAAQRRARGPRICRWYYIRSVTAAAFVEQLEHQHAIV